jgi:hypothetical protein
LQEIKGGELQEISSGELTCCLGFGNFIGYGVGHTKFEVSGLGRHRIWGLGILGWLHIDGS